MSSREISEHTGGQHQHVTRDIEKMFDALGIGGRKLASSYQSAQNKALKEYLLDKELALTLVTGYSVKLRNAVIAVARTRSRAGSASAAHTDRGRQVLPRRA